MPVIRDRVLQARVKNALEPEWEARFESRSYGFRPGRSCQDAIASILQTARGSRARRRWALDADLEGAFDRISHDHLTAMLGQFPARDLVRGWLRAGVMDAGRWAPSVEGTPQGGVISPLLLNIALHGMEQAAGFRADGYRTRAHHASVGVPVLVRYADLCRVRHRSAYAACRVMPNRGDGSVVDQVAGFEKLQHNPRRGLSGVVSLSEQASWPPDRRGSWM
jgi:RNA-directed DNA polymerase